MTGTAGTSGTGGGAGGAVAKKGCWNTPTGNYAMGATLNQEGKIVLFDGTSMAEWKRENTDLPTDWFIDPNSKDMVVKHTVSGPTTDMQSRKTFEDLCLHIEYKPPMLSGQVDQARGNSGVYLKSAYELQILDSRGVLFNTQSCGAIYLTRRANVDACEVGEVWNTFEVEFKGSKWNTNSTRVAGENGYARFMSVTLNGQLIHGGDGVGVPIDKLVTEAGIEDKAGPQPLMLQDHRWAVRFKNIWVRVPQY